MEEYLKEVLEFLTVFSMMKPSEKKEKLTILNEKEVTFLSEVFKNILDKHISISSSEFNKLKVYKTNIRKLARKEYRKQQKIRFLKSMDGSYVLKIVIPAAVRYLSTL